MTDKEIRDIYYHCSGYLITEQNAILRHNKHVIHRDYLSMCLIKNKMHYSKVGKIVYKNRTSIIASEIRHNDRCFIYPEYAKEFLNIYNKFNTLYNYEQSTTD